MAFDDLEALVRGDQSEATRRSALKRRAIALLARRDYSRAELARKLLTPPRPRQRRGARGTPRRAFGAGNAADVGVTRHPPGIAPCTTSKDVAADTDFTRHAWEGDDSLPDADFLQTVRGLRGVMGDSGASGDTHAQAPSPELVESVLDELESLKFLSDPRMAESLVRNNAARFGRARLSQDLQRRGLDESLIDQVLEPLADDEKSRAHTVWERRFGQPPASLKERARQYRFLLGRGFSAGVVASVVPRVSSPASAGAGEDGADGDIDDFFP